MQVPLRVVRTIQIPLVIAGIVLSTLHQSSLGSTLLLMPDKIHPLWFTPILPILFFLSAASVGLAMVIVETSLGSKGLGHHVDLEILAGLGRALPYLLGLYLVVKLGDLLVAGELGLIFSSGLYSLLFLLEVGGGVVTPLVLFALPGVRRSRTALLWSAVLVVLGLVLNRLNVSLIALSPRPGTLYFPHPMEFAISIAVVSAGILAYILANRYLPIVHHEPATEAG
jgi:Ni/Fe-hydrogenase subunit HybB-like protein